MQSHAVNDDLHQDLDFFPSSPVFRVDLDATFVLLKQTPPCPLMGSH